MTAFAPPRWKHLFFSSFVVPLVLLGGVAGTFYLNLHRAASAATGRPLFPAPAPEPENRILVLSPHCDDETLGLGGLMADARHVGVPVTVAFLTNGDGFPLAAGRALQQVDLAPDDYVRFARLRQQEARAALHQLGILPPQIHFLGYPDRGLENLWQEHWTAANAYRSPYTWRNRSPYRNSCTPNTPYAGEALLGDITRLMRQARPTTIFVTHPSDDHPDHAVAAAFAQAALQRCRQSGAPEDAWAKSAQIRYYLIHRGDWPLPQGRLENRPLTPPAALRGLDTHWEAYHVSAPGRAAKRAALACYGSQNAVSARFLSSFLRTNELQGIVAEPVHEEVQREEHSGRLPLSDVPPTVPDATRDDIARYAGSSADLSGLSVWEDNGRLKIRAMTRGPVSPRVQYTIRLRALRAEDDPERSRYIARTIVVPANSKKQCFLEASVPLSALGFAPRAAENKENKTDENNLRCLWASAETRWAGVPIDQTGYRSFLLP